MNEVLTAPLLLTGYQRKLALFTIAKEDQKEIIFLHIHGE